MWIENCIEHFHENSKEITFHFLRDALKKFNYRKTAVFNGDRIIGSASNNIFCGVEPCEKVGGAWAVYVDPKYRLKGIGKRFTVEMEKYFIKNIFL